MNPTEKKNLLKWNTALWIIAMLVPAFFSIALGTTRFPWPMIVPFFLLGPMLASNKFLTQAANASDPQSPNT